MQSKSSTRPDFGCMRRERYRDAAQVFQIMLQAAPTDERGWLALADCHEKLGQRHIALELFSAGTVAAEPAPRCMLSRFRLLYDLNRSQEADEAYDAALELAAAADDEDLAKRHSERKEGAPMSAVSVNGASSVSSPYTDGSPGSPSIALSAD